MAGLAGAPLPSAGDVCIHRVVRALGESVREIFVTDLADLRASVAGRERLRAGVEKGKPRHHQSEHNRAKHYWVCSASTANCAPAAWHTEQLSPNESVFARKWADSTLET